MGRKGASIIWRDQWGAVGHSGLGPGCNARGRNEQMGM